MSSAVRMIRVCEALAEHQPIGVRELARRVSMPRTSVQRALETLEVAGWALRNDAGVWVLTSRPALLSTRGSTGAALRDLAVPALVRLQRATDESVRLWLREGTYMVIAESFDSRQPVRHVGAPPGATVPINASASGKAVLAHLHEAELDAILEAPLEAPTAFSITDPATLRDDLAEVRRRGYAVTRHEALVDVGGVAAPILDATGRAVGALSVTLPMHRLTDAIVEEHGELVRSAAAQVTEQLCGRAAPEVTSSSS